MNSKKFNLLKAAGICGILAPIIGLSCIGLAILYSPWFSWTDNWLSDLGGFPGDEPAWAAHGISSILFNAGLIVAGILGIFFALGLRKSGIFNTTLGNAGTISLLLDTCALIGVGIFPETTGAPHRFFSVVFFFLISLSLLFIGIALKMSSERTLGWLTLALFIFGLISIPLFLTPKPIGSNAIAEMIPIVSISVFSLVFGLKLLRQSFEKKEDEKRNDIGLSEYQRVEQN